MAELEVMIVEDDELAAEILIKLVRQENPDCRIDWQWNGFEALVRLQKAQPDVIFLDYMMPTYDGKELLEGMRRLHSGQHAIIAVVSAYVPYEQAGDFTSLGADFVFPKPVSMDQIRQVLERAAGRQAPAAD
jgi:CheY-like chemotaxis protein